MKTSKKTRTAFSTSIDSELKAKLNKLSSSSKIPVSKLTDRALLLLFKEFESTVVSESLDEKIEIEREVDLHESIIALDDIDLDEMVSAIHKLKIIQNERTFLKNPPPVKKYVSEKDISIIRKPSRVKKKNSTIYTDDLISYLDDLESNLSNKKIKK